MQEVVLAESAASLAKRFGLGLEHGYPGSELAPSSPAGYVRPGSARPQLASHRRHAMTGKGLRQIIRTYYEAWAARDREAARASLTDDLVFVSAEDRFSSADAFLAKCWT